MEPQLSGRRVLVIEDEPMVAWLIEDMLVELGCGVVGPADCVEDALALMKTQPALDAAVLDVNLRGRMVYPVAEVLAAQAVPFIFTSGYARDRLLEPYRGRPYLQKPYHRVALRDMLVGILKLSASLA
jgi:CheY-like chemotaxis protein